MEILKKPKVLSYIFMDLIFSILSMLCAILLRYGYDSISLLKYHIIDLQILSIIAAVSIVTFGLIFGTYNSMLKYYGFSEMFKQWLASFSSGIVLTLFNISSGINLSNSVIILFVMFIFFFSSIVRGIPRLSRWIYSLENRKKGNSKRTLIIGAGSAGATIIKNIQNKDCDIFPVAAIDDDKSKIGLRIAGVPVVGNTDKVKVVCEKYGIEEIVLAIPSASSQQIKHIYEKCSTTGLPVKIFQNAIDMEDFIEGDKKALKNVSIEDLLFRSSIHTDMEKTFSLINGKTILVTGGVGSIGSEICRQVLKNGCKKLIIFDIHENGLFQLNEELKNKYSNYVLCMGSIREKNRLMNVFGEYKPDFVIHAAAHKHVPMMEINPFEAVKNNVIGSKNVLECCVEFGVKRFTLISTDKAVNPTNVMGATKRIVELMVQLMNGLGGCEMTAVRFGNVLGSNGSVIPIFKQQIQDGGPVTITHMDMQRYFMTIPEAVSLVLYTSTLAKGGELFVLDMGQPVKIYDLACNLIKLSGYEPEKDIKIKVTGLRPGEKLFEELSLSNEKVNKTIHEKIFIISTNKCNESSFKSRLEQLINITKQEVDSEALRKCIFDIISEDGRDVLTVDTSMVFVPQKQRISSLQTQNVIDSNDYNSKAVGSNLASATRFLNKQ